MNIKKYEQDLVAIEPFKNNPAEAEWRTYFLEIAQRLEQCLGPWVSYDEAIALMAILHHNRLCFPDGFIINDTADINKEIWIADAAVIAAAFCQSPDEESSWWKREYPGHDKSSDTFITARQTLLEKITTRATLYRG